MFTFSTLLGASSTLIVSGVADKLLCKYGKEGLAETLRKLTYLGAFGYGMYLCVRVIQVAAGLFL
jgi:hypothetical protein